MTRSISGRSRARTIEGFFWPLALALASGGCAANKTNPFEGDPDAEARGEKLYDSEGCITCHNDALQGGPSGPSIVGAARDWDDRKLFRVIKKGPGSMPSFRHLSTDEIWEIVSYLKTVPE